MSLAIADVYMVRKFHRESMKKPAKPAVYIGEGDEKMVGGELREVMKPPVKQSGSGRFGRWFVGKSGVKKSSAKVSDPMAIE
ncbi:hypothetical protein F2Q70_00044450 [Brassica cretica]|uniref:Uncharacterized protein n=4 Tax=Brassica TaxID=3705 RepID=A0A8S9LNF8_BRACR|nr:uncharacterized protein LOC106356936 [Brassica napus]KAF2595370.1 hypothetical protein F2Q70_00044450 [Brassica cretica]KAG2252778.1 hypothetical protein Bca52824_082914 [Brassica carinata]KAF2607597.1 hypothetical protein F2Q68_00045397 [Brassica cretica]KAF3517917.1 hypothetical protein DY000_02062253 [Brassica cretica]KAF3525633.1 hypothetical protein F2Q69_00050085 [Brassica cretica]